MGNCCSNGHEAPRESYQGPAFNKAKFSSYQLKQIENYQKYTPMDCDNRIKDILAQTKTKNAYWPYFVTIFSDCGIQFKTSLTHKSQNQDRSFTMTRNESRASFIQEEYSFDDELENQLSDPPIRVNGTKFSSGDLNFLSPPSASDRSRSDSHRMLRSESVENLVKTFAKPSSAFLTKPGEEGLRNSLHFLLSDQKHVVQIFIKRFHRKFQSKFEKNLMKLKFRRFTEKDNIVYFTVREIIKLFVHVLKKFVQWMYDDLINLMQPVLREEFLELEWIVESVIYELLFSQTDSVQNRLITGLIRSKNMHLTKKFQKILKKRAYSSLTENANFVKSHSIFILQGDEFPYKEVIKSIQDLQVDASPHQEFEKVISLEKEILECACRHYNHEAEMIDKLINGFDRDVKVEILIYCITQSQNTDLVVSRSFIKDFVRQDYLEHVQGFSAFQALMDYLLELQE